MQIVFNNSGQVTDIKDNVLVANGTYGNAVISFVAGDDIPQETLKQINKASLSVIRADGLAINDLYVTVGDGVYTAEIQPSWGVLDVAGTIQISCQFTLSDGSILATIAVAGFVQNNIGTLTKTQADDVETRIKSKYIDPMTKDIAEKVDKSSVGQASGVAGLGSDGKVPMSQLPDFSGGYHITITSSTGTITQDQYNSLMADKGSYIILDNGNEAKEIFRLYDIASGTLKFSRADANRGISIYDNLNYTVTSRPVESTLNKIDFITENSTEEQYPSAKAVYNFVTNKVDAINTELTELDTGEGV